MQRVYHKFSAQICKDATRLIVEVMTEKRARGGDFRENDFEHLEEIHYAYIRLCLNECGSSEGNEALKILLEHYMQIILHRYQVQDENTITELMLLREAIYALYQFGNDKFFTFYSLLFYLLPRDLYEHYYNIFLETYLKITNTCFVPMEPSEVICITNERNALKKK